VAPLQLPHDAPLVLHHEDIMKPSPVCCSIIQTGYPLAEWQQLWKVVLMLLSHTA